MIELVVTTPNPFFSIRKNSWTQQNICKFSAGTADSNCRQSSMIHNVTREVQLLTTINLEAEFNVFQMSDEEMRLSNNSYLKRRSHEPNISLAQTCFNRNSINPIGEYVAYGYYFPKDWTAD